MNRQRLSGTFFAACKVFSNHERYLKYDRVIELTQVQTGQLLIFSRRYTSVLRCTNSLREVSDTFRLFSKNF